MLISFEGTDGCGKSTQISKINKYLRGKGFNVYIFKEINALKGSSNYKFSKSISDILYSFDNGTSDLMLELLLIYSSRRQNLIQNVIPLLDDKKNIVIFDRFVDSSYVCACQDESADLKKCYDIVMNLHKNFCNNLFPDRTFLIHADHDNIESRRSVRAKNDRYDMQPIHRNRKNFFSAASLSPENQERIAVIDGNGTIDNVTQLIINKLEEDLLAKQ